MAVTLFLSEKDVRELLPVSAAIDVLRNAFRELGEGAAVNMPRRRLSYQSGVLHDMAAALPSNQSVGLKAYVSTKTAIGFVVLLFDSASSELLAVFEADWLGRRRTGAASGLATDILARKDAKVAGLIGAGGQAETQIEAIDAVRQLELIKVFSPTERHREELVASLQERVGARLQPVRSAREALEDSDIVSTITRAEAPVFDGNWLKPGVHINAAGANSRKRGELDDRAVERTDLIATDDVEQAKIECGDLLHAAEAGVSRWNDVIELADIVTGKAAGRTSDSQITLFESQGVALEDVAAARYVYDEAQRRGMGTQLPGATG